MAVSNLDPTDAKFIQMAGEGGLAEVEDGRLAERKGSPAVKKIGATMVKDHGEVNAKLRTLALRDSVMVGTTVSDQDAATTKMLSGLTGSAFDAEYLKTQKMAHEKTIALFKTEATTGSDANLKDLAATTLPTLQKHLTMIESASMS